MESPSLVTVQPTAGVFPLKDWRKLPKIAGVYFIRNKVNSKLYVGSASSGKRDKQGIKGRVNVHLRQLINGDHHSVKLQRAFNKYGIGSFEVGCLFIGCDVPKCLECSENHFITKHDSYKNGYNAAPKAYSPGQIPWTESRRAKVAESNKKSWESEELRARHKQSLVGRYRGDHSREETSQKRRSTIREQYSSGKRISTFANKGFFEKTQARRTEGIRNSLLNPHVLEARKLQFAECVKKRIENLPTFNCVVCGSLARLYRRNQKCCGNKRCGKKLDYINHKDAYKKRARESELRLRQASKKPAPISESGLNDSGMLTL